MVGVHRAGVGGGWLCFSGSRVVNPRSEEGEGRGGGVGVRSNIPEGGGVLHPNWGMDAQHELLIWTIRDLTTSEKRGSKRSKTRLWQI